MLEEVTIVSLEQSTKEISGRITCSTPKASR